MDRAGKDDPKIIFDFHMREYASMRSQMSSHVDAMRALERYVAAAVAALYSWILLKHHDIGGQELLDPSNLLWYLPVVVVAFGWLRSMAMSKRTRKLAQYTQEIEKKYADPNLGGWEKFLAASESSSMLLSRRALWVLLLVGSLILSISSHSYHQSHEASDSKNAAQIGDHH